MAKKKQAKKNCNCEDHGGYKPAYYVQNGEPTKRKTRQMMSFLDWCYEYGYTPYFTGNYGKPCGGPGQPHCQ